MKLNNEEDILRLVQSDPWMMSVLETASLLHLPDWWVCAGFVRSKIWDTLHGFAERTPLPDVDVVYFDPSNLDEAEEKRLEEQLRSIDPTIPWSVKNEARMHLINNMSPFSSSTDAISNFTETATALGLSLNEAGQVILTAPHGIEDAVNMVLRPTPHFAADKERHPIFVERIARKNWQQTWSQLRLHTASAVCDFPTLE
ncbi:nucleotidyltransferase family protein [Paenibacillus sp. NPDC058177]|uniref:nucleotidyltransferase family protein n=1 Tax=Paenibacillus sp. NPDC058177 TaxID=3346369 RepID=UPI0036D7994D